MELNEDISYVAGFIVGDGNLSSDYLVRAVEENEDFALWFARIFTNAFGTNPKIYFDKYNKSFVIYKHSKYVWDFLVNGLKIPSGDKSKIVKIPQRIQNADDKIKSAFLSGLFDAEGCVTINVEQNSHPRGYLKIQFKVANKILAEQVFNLLVSFGIKPRLYNYNGFSCVYLNGKTQCKLFQEKVGFKHPAKIIKLSTFLDAS